MKNIRYIVTAILTFSLVLMGCGETSHESSSETSKEKIAVVTPSPSVMDVLEEKTSESADISQDTLSEASAAATSDSYAALYPYQEMDSEVSDSISLSSIEGVDIDLTALSSTMVYGQVYNMMYYPENFIGQTIRMEGFYSDYYDQAKGKRYFACIIMDATACCSQGIEFELTEEYSYPDDYPEVGDEVVVEGVFDLYEEDGYDYCVLRNSKLITS